MLEEKVGWCSQTNWNVTQGDLRKTILLDASTSLPFKADVEPTAVEPLLLKPSPSARLGPCEITVKFSQKHEIHRVYLWSTARVFEMYYATQQGENEYLCTTRCGLVKRKCYSFQSDCSSISSSGEGTKIDHTDEDGWIDVKVAGFVLPDEANPSLKTSEIKKQEVCCFYEGTADINGSIPCFYLTIRLLSMYPKGSVCIRQLCILASPTTSLSVSEPPTPAVGSGHASLLVMLVPSLIQLSRAGSEAQGRAISGSMGLCSRLDMETEGRIQMEKPEEDIEEVERLQQSSGAAKECTGWSRREEDQSARLKDVSHVSGAVVCTGGKEREESESVRSNGESHRSTSCNCRCEEVLRKLNEKIDQIVTHCANLQESMTKPLVSMETRLKQLEEKLTAVLTSELIKHVNFSLDGVCSEDYGGTEKVDCQSRKQKVVGFDTCKHLNCSGSDDESATEDSSGSGSKDTSCSGASSDSSSVSDEDDVRQDEDVGSEVFEENENEPDEKNMLVLTDGTESCDLSCMSGSNAGKNCSVTDDDYAEEHGETDEHASVANGIEENVKDHLGSADASNTMTLLSVKSKLSIDETVVSALSDFLAAASAATDGSCSEGASITGMNIIDKESWRPAVTDAIFSRQSTEGSQLLACGGTACHDQLVAERLGNSNLIGGSGSTISIIRCTNELQLNGVQEELGLPEIQYEESLKVKAIEPLPLDQNLVGFEILNRIKKHNQHIKSAFMANLEDFNDSLLDVKFVVDKNCQSNFSLEALLGGHDLATATCTGNRSLNYDCLLSLEEDPIPLDCKESSSNQIDKFSMSEERQQIDPIMEGWWDTAVDGLDC